MVWYGHSYVTAGITLDDFVILSSRPRKPIPGRGTPAYSASKWYEYITQLALIPAHTGCHVPPVLGIVMLFKFHTSVTTIMVQSTFVL